MNIKIQITVESDEGQPEVVQEVAHLDRGSLRPETLGLTLAEARSILAGIEQTVVEQQAAEFIAQQRIHTVSEKLLLERVTAAAEERHLSQNTLTAYRRTWLKAIAWAAAEGLALETLPSERAGEFYEEATRGRSASHHLQVKAALSLLYHVMGSTNPFAECPTPKFAPEKTELRYHIFAIGRALARTARGAPQLLWTPDIAPRRCSLFYRPPGSRVCRLTHATGGCGIPLGL